MYIYIYNYVFRYIHIHIYTNYMCWVKKMPQHMCPWTAAHSQVTSSMETRPNNGHACDCEWDTSGKLCE